ncbi:hypothetical protein, partial [Nocardia nova]
PADGPDGHAGVAGTVEADADAEPSARTTPPDADASESPDGEPAAERTSPKPAGESAGGSDDSALADKEDINP